MGEGRGSGSARPSRATKSRHPSLHLNAAQQLGAGWGEGEGEGEG